VPHVSPLLRDVGIYHHTSREAPWKGTALEACPERSRRVPKAHEPRPRRRCGATGHQPVFLGWMIRCANHPARATALHPLSFRTRFSGEESALPVWRGHSCPRQCPPTHLVILRQRSQSLGAPRLAAFARRGNLPPHQQGSPVKGHGFSRANKGRPRGQAPTRRN